MKIEVRSETDFLAIAANAKHCGIAAAKAGNFDEAWKQFHIQKQAYMQHAGKCGFTKKELLALDGSVHEFLADVLRREGKHKQALMDIIYWIATSSRATKTQDKKLVAYFNRAKIENRNITHITQFISELRDRPDFRKIQDYVLAHENT